MPGELGDQEPHVIDEDAVIEDLPALRQFKAPESPIELSPETAKLGTLRDVLGAEKAEELIARNSYTERIRAKAMRKLGRAALMP